MRRLALAAARVLLAWARPEAVPVVDALDAYREGRMSAARCRALCRAAEASAGVCDGDEAAYEAARAGVDEDLAAGRIDEEEAAVRRIEVDARFGRKPKFAAELARARHEKRPWIAVVSSEYEEEEDDEAPGTVALELEWTPAFVERLREAGYPGDEDEEVVDSWFARTCALIAIEADPTLLEMPGLSRMRIERREAEDQIVFR